MNRRFKETSRRGAIGWFFQRITAVIIFALVMFHFYTYHFISKGNAPAYANIVKKAGTWWFPLIQFLFLVTALFHGLYGVWVVLEDYVHNKYWRYLFYSLLVTVATVLLFVGTLTIIKVATLKAS